MVRYFWRWLARRPSRQCLRQEDRRKPRRPLLVEILEARDLPSGFLPNIVLLPHDGANPLSTAGPTGTTPAQIRHAYGFDQIAFANGAIPGDGRGTTIAIVDAYDNPNIASDLHQFNLRFGLPDSGFTKVNQNGGTNMPAADAGWASEIALDVEWAHAIAPAANILLVEASDNSYANLLAAVRFAASQPGVVAVSMSFGGDEFTRQLVYDSYFVTPTGHAGVTFVASSGDTGAPASYPAASPNVLSVGGTTLRLDSAGNILGETVWSGSGGGLSSYEVQPAYQRGVVTQSSTARGTPDVAYNSDPSTGFPVYDSYNNPASAPWSQYGGTSAAAPQWAALLAIADQGRALAGLGSLDGASQTLPMLYSLAAADFRDTTSGTSRGTPNYSAGAGYDLATGLGTPIANRLVFDLIGTGASSRPVITLPQGDTFSMSSTASSLQVPFVATDPNNKPLSLSATLAPSGTNYTATIDTVNNVIALQRTASSQPYSGALQITLSASNGTDTTQKIINVNITLTAPSAIAPSGVITTDMPTFSWNAVTAAAHYDVWVNDSTTGQIAVLRNANAAGTSWTPSASQALTPGHSYMWYVGAVTTDGLSTTWNNGLSITVASMSTPTPLSPAGTIAAEIPTFTWTAVSGAVRYDVWVNSIINGVESVGNPTLRNANATGTSWTPTTALNAGQSYKWYIGAVSSNGTTLWSVGQIFSIAPLAAPTPTAPSGTVATDTPTFTWTAVAGAAHYDIWVNSVVSGKESVGNPVLRNANATGTSWTPSTALVPGQAYRWYIGTVSAAGATFWSSGQNFSIAPLSAPTPLAPSGTVTTTTPTFSWTAVSGAAHYDVWINTVINGVESVGSPILRNANATGTSWTPTTALSSGQSYRWYIGTVASNGATFWSSGVTFTINAAAPLAALSPSGSIATLTPTFSWTPSATAVWYDIWVNDLTGAYVALRNPFVTGTSWTANVSLTRGHTYVWYVGAVNAFGFTTWNQGTLFYVTA